MVATINAEVEPRDAPGLPETAGAILVLAVEEPGAQLLDELRMRGLDEKAEVLVVAPALASRVGLWTDEESWHRRAETIARGTTARLAAAGFSSRGQVGDPDPLEALDDALRSEQVAEVIVVCPPADRASWLEHDLVARVRVRAEVPVTLVSGSGEERSELRAANRHGGRVAMVAVPGIVVALVLALVGVGRVWLVGELAVVFGIVLLDIAAHLAVLGGALWLALGPLARRFDRRTARPAVRD